MPTRSLVLATRNPGKLNEFKALLAGFQVEIQSLLERRHIPEIPEEGRTFFENAAQKAQSIAAFCGLPALADDSGLSVEALKGEPGVHSARYAGPGATDQANIRKLLDALQGIQERQAAFECVLAIAKPDGEIRFFSGRCQGQIASHPLGSNGFGYDPIFYYPPLAKTFAQLSATQKNRVSHRGQAMQALRDEFNEVLTWLDKK